MAYTLNQFGGINRDLDGASIPADPGNRDYQEYLAWVAEGNTPAPVPIDDLKAAKLAQIEADRDAACVATVNVIGHPWQADARSQSLLSSSILLAQAGVYTPSVWRDESNVDVAVTLADLVLIAGVMAAQTQAAYAASWARKAALAAATTAEQVAAC